MLKTETEARLIWCPYARTAMAHDAIISPGRGDGAAGANRYDVEGRPEFPLACACITTRCMAWEAARDLKSTRDDKPPPGEGWKKLGVSADGYEWGRDAGYCSAFHGGPKR